MILQGLDTQTIDAAVDQVQDVVPEAVRVSGDIDRVQDVVPEAVRVSGALVERTEKPEKQTQVFQYALAMAVLLGSFALLWTGKDKDSWKMVAPLAFGGSLALIQPQRTR